MKKSQARIGQHVEIIDGVLKGERATITAHPETGQYMDKDGSSGSHLSGIMRV